MQMAQVLLGLGLVCWLVLGSIIMARLIFRPMLPTPLIPTLAIEMAPAAVASLAWFQIHGAEIHGVVAAFGGYGLLMVLAQIRLLPAFVRLPFIPSVWAFTFSWAAVSTVVLIWLDSFDPAGAVIWQFIVAAAITMLIVGIGLRTLVAVMTGTLLPKPRDEDFDKPSRVVIGVAGADAEVADSPHQLEGFEVGADLACRG